MIPDLEVLPGWLVITVATVYLVGLVLISPRRSRTALVVLVAVNAVLATPLAVYGVMAGQWSRAAGYAAIAAISVYFIWRWQAQRRRDREVARVLVRLIAAKDARRGEAS